MLVTDPKSTQFPSSAAELAERILAMTPPDEYTWEDRAYEVLRTLLRENWPATEGGLTGLLERAHAQGGDEAVEEWLYRMERASTTDRVLRNNRFQTAKLLTLPLALIPGDTPIESALDQSRATVEIVIEKVMEKLKKSGLVRGEAGLYALPRLYTAAELGELSYAEVVKLLDIGVEGVVRTRERSGLDMAELPVPSNVESVPNVVEALLANPVFLVMAHIDDSQHSPFDARSSAGLTPEAFRSRYLDWAFESTELLEEAIGADVFVEMSAFPLDYYEGFQVGVEGARGILLTAEVAALCMPTEGPGVSREDIVTQFLNVTDEEVRLWFRHVETGQTLGTAYLPVFDWETADVARDNIEALLYDMGIAWPGILPADVSGPCDSVQEG
jgi:DNA-binding IscR family transcriptional regulator